jgi:hypothetical protein
VLLFLEAVLLPVVPPFDFDDLAPEPLFDAVFAEPLFAVLVPLAFFAAPDAPDLAPPVFAAPDFADEDLAPPVLETPDFAVVDLALPVFEALGFADDAFADEAFEPPVFVAVELFPPLFAAPLVARDRAPELFAVEPFPVTVSAAAPRAPTAAPVAAPLRISPATSITASITFSVVEAARRLVPLLELFELEDVDRLLFVFVFLLSGMLFSHWSY